MIVSGLPVRNGLLHAGEIANAALELLTFAVNFRIRHLPENKLLLRIGIHSGKINLCITILFFLFGLLTKVFGATKS